MVSDHEDRVRACILMVSALFLEEVGARWCLVDRPSTLGCRKCSIMSRSEQERDDVDDVGRDEVWNRRREG